METITTFRGDTYEKHFLLAAITRATAGGLPRDAIAMPLQVVLTVNGVELPFTATMADYFERVRQAEMRGANSQVAEKLDKVVLGDKLERVREMADRIERFVASEIAQIGIELD